MLLTQKIRVYLTKEQEKVLWNLSAQCRRLYNLGLAERREAYVKGEKISYQIQQNELILTKQAYPEFRMVYIDTLPTKVRSFLADFSCKVLQMALNQLDGDYKSFFALRRNGDSAAICLLTSRAEDTLPLWFIIKAASSLSGDA